MHFTDCTRDEFRSLKLETLFISQLLGFEKPGADERTGPLSHKAAVTAQPGLGSSQGSPGG